MRTLSTKVRHNSAPQPSHFGRSGRQFQVQAKMEAEPSIEKEMQAGMSVPPLPSFGNMRVFPEHSSITGSGTPLPSALREKMERGFQTDFSGVRVYQGPVAESLSAQAFTRGREIHFAPGKYNPSTLEGQKLIGHELAHVVQQGAGRVEAPPGSDVPINFNSALETEADVVGGQVAQGQPANLRSNVKSLPENEQSSKLPGSPLGESGPPKVSGIQLSINRGRKGGGNRRPGNLGKRQGKKGQRDKKHGLMNDPKWGDQFTKWLHRRKQKSGDRGGADNYTASEIKDLEAEFLSEQGLEAPEVEPQPERNFDLPPEDSSDDTEDEV